MRYLVVGLGNIGRKRRDLLGERCVATVDPFNPEADLADRDALPANRYDAAILAVPNRDKLGLATRFLDAGKHVLVEKPLLVTDDEADRLKRAARARGAACYTSYNHRFEPLVARLKARLEEGVIGPILHGRLLYGNGTVANVAGTWRDAGLGVVEDLGPHLFDLAGYLLEWSDDVVAWSVERHLAASPDHAVLATRDGRLVLEVSYLCWKNSFSIDLFGERGSLHLDGLRKWGPSELVLRERKLPSGVPSETRETSVGPDESWARDLEHFETLCAAGQTSLANDRRISRTLRAVGRAAMAGAV